MKTNTLPLSQAATSLLRVLIHLLLCQKAATYATYTTQKNYKYT